MKISLTPEITICTVSFKHRSLIETNIAYVQKMNPGASIKWIVVENTPEGDSQRFEIGERGSTTVFEGVPNTFKGIAPASYHHASGLNTAVRVVTTRYALVLDPDFFIVRKNWLADVLEEMQEKGLAFFGAPYNPKRYMKYRYFPCLHCMFIDLEKVKKDELDFTPEYNQAVLLSNREHIETMKKESENPLTPFYLKLKNHARTILKRGGVIGSSRDTGYRVYSDFHADPDSPSECVTPVFTFKNSGIRPAYLASWFNHMIETLLPDRLSYIPKQAGYFSKRGFKAFGFPDIFKKGWDEFMWRGMPFGFHLQGARKDGTTTDHSKDAGYLEHVLGMFEKSHTGRTIFVSIFEGVESKNILRTGIVDKILEKNPDTHVVLLVKNEERAQYYSNEFSHPRVSFEIVTPLPMRWIDRVFSAWKFYFLRTETTELRAKMNNEDRSKIQYYFSLIKHRILAQPIFISIFRALDSLFTTRDGFDDLFEKYHPELVLLANLFDDFETDFLKAAKKYKAKTITLINSWDRLTARCIIRTLPDRFVTYNETLRDQLITLNLVDPATITIVGIPQYDPYFLPPTLSRDEYFRHIGIDPSKKIIIYAPLGGRFSNSDWDIMDHLYDLHAKGKFGQDSIIIVRFSPNDFINPEELKKRPHLVYQYPGTRFSKTMTTDWDMTAHELADLRNFLQYMSVILCYASSISIDAAVLDKPVININYEVKDNKSLAKSPTTFYKMTHYAGALETGGIHLAGSEQDLVSAVNAYLKDPSIDHEGRKKLALRQCTFLDGKSAERIADAVTDLLTL